MHATFYVNSALVGLPGRMTWGQLFDLAANGHEIGGHGVEHVQLTALSEGEAAREISDDRQALISHGFDTTDFAYPYGTYNKRIGSIVQRCGYRSARRSWGLSPIGLSPPDCNRWYPDVVERIPPEDRYAVRTIVPVRAWHTLGDIQSAVTRAERNGGGWVILVFHRICDGCDPVRGYSVSPSTFARLLDWLEGRADRGTHVLTVQDVISEKQRAAKHLAYCAASKKGQSADGEGKGSSADRLAPSLRVEARDAEEGGAIPRMRLSLFGFRGGSRRSA
jgi:peptidoglycan/xylan/chitin deacetylase (PgdA/CDA1 family)